MNSGNGSELKHLSTNYYCPFFCIYFYHGIFFLAVSTVSGQTKIGNPIFIAFLKD
tara:strand:+ start:258 stop:422 length:165 start_codon:yes stop_codon:yes gene_type:complete